MGDDSWLTDYERSFFDKEIIVIGVQAETRFAEICRKESDHVSTPFTNKASRGVRLLLLIFTVGSTVEADDL